MPTKTFLSCLFAAALAACAFAQEPEEAKEASEPAAPTEATETAGAPETAETPETAEPAETAEAKEMPEPTETAEAPAQPDEAAPAETDAAAATGDEAPSPADPSPEAAADAVAMPASSEPAASDGNPLFAEPVDAAADPMPLFDDFMSDEPEAERRFERSRTAIANDQLRLRVKLRQAKTKAERDDAVVAARAAVDSAPTFPERREALRAYYKILDEKIVKLDPSVKELAQQRSALAIQKLEQRRLAGKKTKDADTFAD